MFVIKKMIAAFVLPPGIMVLALGGLAFYLRRRCRPAALICAALAAGVWGGTTKAFSELLLRPLESAYSTPARPQGDVIILLCGGFMGGGNPYSASERLAPGTLERAAAAYKLHKDTGLPVLISGGAPFSPEPESEATAAWLGELGMKSKDILTEVRSRDTEENAAYSLKICGEKGFKKPLLLTSAYHMPRSVLLFKKAGAAGLTPFPVAKRAGGPLYLRDWLPGGGITETRLAINEYLGLAWYRLYFFF